MGRRGGRAVRFVVGRGQSGGGGGDGDGGGGSSRSSLLSASTERARFTESRREVGRRCTGGAATETGRGGLQCKGTGRGAGVGGGRSSSKCSREVARRNTEGRRRGASRRARLRYRDLRRLTMPGPYRSSSSSSSAGGGGGGGGGGGAAGGATTRERAARRCSSSRFHCGSDPLDMPKSCEDSRMVSTIILSAAPSSSNF